MRNKTLAYLKSCGKEIPAPLEHPIQDSDILELLKSVAPYGLTRRGIAECYKRKVSPSLIARIEKLAAANWIIRDRQYWPNRTWGYVYYFPLDVTQP